MELSGVQNTLVNVTVDTFFSVHSLFPCVVFVWHFSCFSCVTEVNNHYSIFHAISLNIVLILKLLSLEFCKVCGRRKKFNWMAVWSFKLSSSYVWRHPNRFKLDFPSLHTFLKSEETSLLIHILFTLNCIGPFLRRHQKPLNLIKFKYKWYRINSHTL